MIYGGDLNIQFPVRDIYDTGIMSQYLSAVKQQYEQGVADMQNYTNMYNDFSSPFQKDVDWWNKNVSGKFNDMINKAYEQGIDPVRSPEFRAALRRELANLPYGEMQRAKRRAAVAEEYRKARGVLQAKGLWNPQYESHMLSKLSNTGRTDATLENWDPQVDGDWTRTSPDTYQDLTALTGDWYKNIKPSSLGTQNGYEYEGVTRDRALGVALQGLPDLINTPNGQYLLQTIAAQNGIDTSTPEGYNQAVGLLANNIVDRNHAVYAQRKAADAYKLADYRAALAEQADINKMGRKMKYDMALAQYKAQLDLVKDEEKAKRKTARDIASGKVKDNVFRIAERNGVGGYGQYNPEDTYKEKVKPVPAGVTLSIRNVTNKGEEQNSSSKSVNYMIDGDLNPGTVYTHNSVYGKNEYLKSYVAKGGDNRKFVFKPTGRIHARKFKVGKQTKLRYFMGGNLYSYDPNNPDNMQLMSKDGSKVFEMEVRENK